MKKIKRLLRNIAFWLDTFGAIIVVAINLVILPIFAVLISLKQRLSPTNLHGANDAKSDKH